MDGTSGLSSPIGNENDSSFPLEKLTPETFDILMLTLIFNEPMQLITRPHCCKFGDSVSL